MRNSDEMASEKTHPTLLLPVKCLQTVVSLITCQYEILEFRRIAFISEIAFISLLFQKMRTLEESELNFIRLRCESALEDIRWTNTAENASSLTLKQALVAARLGHDAGLEHTKSLQPSSTCHAEWMDYVYLLTMLFNRNRPFRKFTILRKGLLFNYNA